jgi:hypothetical protein
LPSKHKSPPAGGRPHLYRGLAHLRALHQPHNLRQHGVPAHARGAHEQRAAGVEGAADEGLTRAAEHGLALAWCGGVWFCGLGSSGAVRQRWVMRPWWLPVWGAWGAANLLQKRPRPNATA